MSNLKKSLSISAVFLFAIVSSALAENNAAKPSLTHIMTYILNWHETDIGAAEKIGEGRTIYPLSGHVTMADGTKGKIVGQTADWNDGPTDNGFNIIDVRASVKLDDTNQQT